VRILGLVLIGWILGYGEWWEVDARVLGMLRETERCEEAEWGVGSIVDAGE
jgi:hypothetical protein